MTKKEKLINFIEKQTNIKLENNPEIFLNSNRNYLYTKINKEDKNTVLNLLSNKHIRCEEHNEDYYWIYLFNMEEIK